MVIIFFFLWLLQKPSYLRRPRRFSIENSQSPRGMNIKNKNSIKSSVNNLIPTQKRQRRYYKQRHAVRDLPFSNYSIGVILKGTGPRLGRRRVSIRLHRERKKNAVRRVSAVVFFKYKIIFNNNSPYTRRETRREKYKLPLLTTLGSKI